MANAQYAKHQLFRVRSQSYEPGVRRSVTSEELSREQEAFFASGGRVQVCPPPQLKPLLESTPKPQPKCPRKVVTKKRNRHECEIMRPEFTMTTPETWRYCQSLGYAGCLESFRDMCERGNGPVPEEIRTSKNGKTFKYYTQAGCEMWIANRGKKS